MASESSAQEGQTETPALGEDVGSHFVCFVEAEVRPGSLGWPCGLGRGVLVPDYNPDTRRPPPHTLRPLNSKGDLYELDGSKAGPINHGPTGGEFLSTAAKVVKDNFVDQANGSLLLSMMALCIGGGDDD